MARCTFAHIHRAPIAPFPGGFAQVTHALVIFHLDYCNVVYLGRPLKATRKIA